MVVAAINSLGFAIFGAALWWRVLQIRRSRGDIQALALVVAIGSFTVSVIVLFAHGRESIDEVVFTGFSRLLGHTLLALGVAALLVVFLATASEDDRLRRASIEAIPLVVLVIALNTAMAYTPAAVRDSPISEWTGSEIGFAAFFLAAGAYVIYALGTVARSMHELTRMAENPLRISLQVMSVGVLGAAAGNLLVCAFIVESLLTGEGNGTVFTIAGRLGLAGPVIFLIGLMFPAVHAGLAKRTYRNQHERELARLQPLWELLTNQVPEVVMPIAGAQVTVHERFRRSVVEIRDILVQISPHLPDDFAPTDVAALDAALLTYRDRRSEALPSRPVLAVAGDSVDDDAAPLLLLADAVRAAHGPAHPDGPGRSDLPVEVVERSRPDRD